MLRLITRDEVLTRLDIAYDILLTTSVIGDKVLTDQEKEKVHKITDWLKEFSDELDKSYTQQV
jgi:hypothetical protein